MAAGISVYLYWDQLASVASLLRDDVTTLCSAAEGLSKASDKLFNSATDKATVLGQPRPSQQQNSSQIESNSDQSYLALGKLSGAIKKFDL